MAVSFDCALCPERFPDEVGRAYHFSGAHADPEELGKALARITLDPPSIHVVAAERLYGAHKVATVEMPEHIDPFATVDEVEVRPEHADLLDGSPL